MSQNQTGNLRYVAKEEYDISWTMPQCVLCLRLIGLSWDLYDGARMKQNPESLSKDQQKTALISSPNVLEMLSHSFDCVEYGHTRYHRDIRQ